MPKYLALLYDDTAEETRENTPEETQAMMADYMEFGRKAESVILGGEALHPTDTATTVHVEGGKGGKPVFTDGPFAETKEVLGGFYLLDVADLDTALQWAQQIPAAWHGKVEVRPIIEFDDQGNAVS